VVRSTAIEMMFLLFYYSISPINRCGSDNFFTDLHTKFVWLWPKKVFMYINTTEGTFWIVMQPNVRRKIGNHKNYLFNETENKSNFAQEENRSYEWTKTRGQTMNESLHDFVLFFIFFKFQLTFVFLFVACQHACSSQDDNIKQWIIIMNGMNVRRWNLHVQQKKQILAQQPGGVRAFPFGISRQICFFSEVGLSDQCPQPSFT
jgi:hypothetical protein